MSMPMNFAPVPFSAMETFANRRAYSSANPFVQPLSQGMPLLSPSLQSRAMVASGPARVTQPAVPYRMSPTYNPRLGETSVAAFSKGLRLGVTLMCLPLLGLLTLWFEHRDRSSAHSPERDNFSRHSLDWEAARDAEVARQMQREEFLNTPLSNHVPNARQRSPYEPDNAHGIWHAHRGWRAQDTPQVPLAPLNEAPLSAPVRQKLADLRAIIADQPGNLSHVFINANRSNARDTEFCFTFADADRFPAAQRNNEDYSMGTLQLYIPTASIPPRAFNGVRQLKQWLNLPQVRDSVNFRVQR